MTKEMYDEMRKTIKIAKELFYSREVVCALKNAKDMNEMSQIMKNARRNY